MEFLNNNEITDEIIDKVYEAMSEEVISGSNGRGTESAQKSLFQNLSKRAIKEVL